jgi:hypothetical protein
MYCLSFIFATNHFPQHYSDKTFLVDKLFYMGKIPNHISKDYAQKKDFGQFGWMPLCLFLFLFISWWYYLIFCGSSSIFHIIIILSVLVPPSLPAC